jgi:hypothetical protein
MMEGIIRVLNPVNYPQFMKYRYPAHYGRGVLAWQVAQLAHKVGLVRELSFDENEFDAGDHWNVIRAEFTGRKIIHRVDWVHDPFTLPRLTRALRVTDERLYVVARQGAILITRRATTGDLVCGTIYLKYTLKEVLCNSIKHRSLRRS